LIFDVARRGFVNRRGTENVEIRSLDLFAGETQVFGAVAEIGAER
jgi:hypothetical protein